MKLENCKLKGINPDTTILNSKDETKIESEKKKNKEENMRDFKNLNKQGINFQRNQIFQI